MPGLVNVMPGGVYMYRSLLGGGGLKLVLVTEQLVKYGIADFSFPAHIDWGTSKPGKLGAWGPGCLIFVLCLVPRLQLHRSAYWDKDRRQLCSAS